MQRPYRPRPRHEPAALAALSTTGKVLPPTDGSAALGAYTSCTSLRHGVGVPHGEFCAYLNRYVTLAGRVPACVFLYQLGYHPDGAFRFPVTECKILWEEYGIVPLVVWYPAGSISWMAEDQRLENILQGSLDGTFRTEAQRARQEYGGPLLVAKDWEKPNIGSSLVAGDGWPWSDNAELIQIEAERQTAAGMTTLDGRPWYAGPAAHIQAMRRLHDVWIQECPETTWLSELCHDWGDTRPWMHPKWWFEGAAYADWIGGGVYPWDQGTDGNGQPIPPPSFVQAAEPLFRQIGEIPGVEHLDVFLEIGAQRQAAWPSCQADFYRQCWDALRNPPPGPLQNIRQRVKLVHAWDDPTSVWLWGTDQGETAGMGIDATPDCLQAFREGATDPRLFGPVGLRVG